MKKLFYILCCLLAVVFTACESEEPKSPEDSKSSATSDKVETGTSSNVTESSATLKGFVNVDISVYNNIEFGIMYDSSLEEVNNRSAQKINARILQSKEFTVDIKDLKSNTKYYYCAYLFLNGMQYEYGAVKELNTRSSEDEGEENDPTKPGDKDDDDSTSDGSFVAMPFSVSANKTVTFSPGNLQYHAANEEWRFAPNQTDYIGYDNENISSTYNGWIDLFGWGTGDNPTNKSTDNYDYQTFVDWGVNKIGSYSPNTWRTLTYDEWYYLRYQRPNYDKLIGIAEVNGVNGLILLPDAWVCPSGVTFKAGFDNDWCTECYGNYQTISALEWSKLEASGAVFLPAAGNRYGSDVYFVQYYGLYWSATERDNSSAYGLDFFSDEANMRVDTRYDGRSVRLVQD